MPGPKADRLSLLRATNTQLSPILMAYFDPSEPDLPAGTDAWRARDDDGLLHELAVDWSRSLAGRICRASG